MAGIDRVERNDLGKRNIGAGDAGADKVASMKLDDIVSLAVSLRPEDLQPPSGVRQTGQRASQVDGAGRIGGADAAAAIHLRIDLVNALQVKDPESGKLKQRILRTLEKSAVEKVVEKGVDRLFKVIGACGVFLLGATSLSIAGLNDQASIELRIGRQGAPAAEASSFYCAPRQEAFAEKSHITENESRPTGDAEARVYRQVLEALASSRLRDPAEMRRIASEALMAMEGLAGPEPAVTERQRVLSEAATAHEPDAVRGSFMEME